MAPANVSMSNRLVGSGLGRYMLLGRKWLWLILLLTALGGIAGYFFAQTIPPTFRATTTMLIGQLQQNSNPTETDLQASTNLSAAYALLAQQPRILQATAQAVNYPGPWQTLYFAITTAAQPQLLRINVTSRDPVQAQAIANELANQLVLQGPVSEQQTQAETERQFIQEQLVALRQQILTGQKTVQDLTNRTTIENDPDTLKDLNARLDSLQEKVDNWQANYASLSDLLNRDRGLYVAVLAPAGLPDSPVSPNVPQIILLGALIGFIVSCVAIYFL
ncbi:MAG TPA: Wzz/FepE/Etk N-terminal domain-containing protein, partial [Anaerolineae bacterium]|nr:Wzz/FepE/Etk N-terminal domain-containing protein [Anaerolineae bacterium]